MEKQRRTERNRPRWNRGTAGRFLALLRPGVLAALMFCGCAGYELGPTGGRRAGGLSVQVNPFENKTLEPRLSDAVTDSLRRQLQQDGTYHLDTAQTGDIIVTGAITDYVRSGVSFVPKDTLTPQDYRVRITAHVIARERAGGRVILDRKVQGTTILRVGPDLPSVERQAIPLAAEDLARHATSLLVDGTW
jgi:hypothetical protein